ncbi:MAG TPA: Wzz/FepE/Etk N-terminal domain-containing protein [Magnetospirillum sp.]|nr:Wzz/FepE/Etk N-terminal domain-containing protein [Magnetospirillum sp.]
MMVADETETRGPTEALSVLWQRKTMIGAVVAGSTALAVVALQVIPPRYTAEALIALNTRTSASEQLLTTKPNVVTPPLTTVMVSTEINILESRELAGQVVDALALERDAEFNARLEPTVLPAWMTTAWRSLRGEDDGLKDDRTLTVDAVLKRLKVKSDADSYVIRLYFDSEDPRKAALIANAFTDLYIRGQREAKLAEMQLATDWISKQINQLQGELAKESGAAVRLRQKYKISPVDVREKGVLASQQLVTLTGELALVERERAEAEASLAQARRVMKTGGATTSLTFVEESPFLQEMRREEAKILGRMAELSVGYRDDSPAMGALKGQLATMRAEIDREVAKQVDRMANKAAQARAREDVLKARIDSIQNRTTQSDEAVTEIEQREKLVEAKNLMLESFLSRYAELTNRAEVQEPDARVASRATAPAKPSAPKPLLFLGVAFAGSSALSISLAFLLERFRTGFRSTRQVREALDLPTLGILPDTGKATPRVLPGDYLVDRPESVYAEAVRSAQIAITNAREGKSRATLITSSVPGEGKTAFAVSLGRSLALAERKVVLVDCDLRRPAVARQLAAYEVPGLTDYLRQQSSLEEILRHDSRSGLDFVASGGRTTEPQRLLEDAGLPKLFDRLFALYDMVLVDTPPTMVAFDAALLAPYADFSLYVVEWDRTPKRAVEAGIEHLRSFEIPVGGVVLTKVDLERQRQYSDYVDFCFRSSDYYGN